MWEENRFILDKFDDFDAVDLQFGTTLEDRIRFDKILDKFIIHKNIDFGDYALENLRVENRTTAPVCDVSKTGKLYYNTQEEYLSVCSGLTWNALVTGQGNFPLPYVSDFTQQRTLPSFDNTFSLKGAYFTPTTTVAIEAQTVHSVDFIDDNTLEVYYSSGNAEGSYDIEITNSSGSTLLSQGVVVAAAQWQDLRVGGATFTHGNAAGNDIRYPSGMTLVRNVDGMYFTGANPWSSWVKFESLGWNRGDENTLEWIFTTPNGAMMIGIGSDATNESSTAQYGQAEVLAYFTNASNFWGLYGNNGNPGGISNQAQNTPINSSGVYKVKFENDGKKDAKFTLYQLPSASEADWNDESTIITSFAIGGSINPDEPNLMPFIIPRSSTSQKFIAVRIR